MEETASKRPEKTPSEQMKSKLDYWKNRYSKLDSLHGPWRGVWKEVGTYVYPDRGDFTMGLDPSSNSRRRSLSIYDTTAPFSLEQFSAALVGLLTSPAERWFTLEMAQRELNQNIEVRRHLEIITNILYNEVFSNPVSNFQSQSHALYMDLGAFGTGIMMIEDIPGRPIMFTTHHLNDCRIYENRDGFVDTVYRIIRRSGRELLDKYPDKFGGSVLDTLKNRPFEKFEVIHAVEPILDQQQRKYINTNKPFASIMYMPRFDVILEEGGYQEFPYVVPRWIKSTGETYGRSPSLTMMPTIRLVNRMMETILKAAQKVTDPPLQAPDDGFVLPLRMTPSAINFYRSGSGDRIEPIGTGAQPQIGFELLKDQQLAIQKAFHVDILDLPEDKVERSATEILQRQENKMRKMAPAAGRIQSEYLTMMMRRVYAIAVRRAMFPDPPEPMINNPVTIRYISPVARAQRLTQLNAATQWLNSTVQLMQFRQDAGDSINVDGWVRWSHELLGATAEIINDKKAIENIRKQRNQQQQMMNESQMLESAGKSAQSFAKANELASKSGAPGLNLNVG